MHVVAFIKFTILQLVSVCPTCFFSFVSLPNASGDHLGLCSGWLDPEHLPMFVSWESFSSQLPGHAFLSLSKSHSMHTWLSSQEKLKGNLREILGELFFFCMAHSFLEICSGTLSCLCCFECWSVSWWSHQALFASPFYILNLEIASRQRIGTMIRPTSFASLPSKVMILHCLLSSI